MLIKQKMFLLIVRSSIDKLGVLRVQKMASTSLVFREMHDRKKKFVFVLEDTNKKGVLISIGIVVSLLLRVDIIISSFFMVFLFV